MGFPPAVPLDKVHAEALCAVLRRQGTELASHSTDHGKLRMRLRFAVPLTDQAIQSIIKSAALELAQGMDDLLRQSGSLSVP